MGEISHSHRIRAEYRIVGLQGWVGTSFSRVTDVMVGCWTQGGAPEKKPKMISISLSKKRIREYGSGAVTVGLLVGMAALSAAVTVNHRQKPTEFVELNLGRISPERLSRILDRSFSGTDASDDRQEAAPDRKLPEVEVPSVRVTDQERLVLPDRVSSADDKVTEPRRMVTSPRKTNPRGLFGDRKIAYTGASIDIDQGIGTAGSMESEAIGGDVEPVIKIEGQLQGREFFAATGRTLIDLPPRTRLQFSLIVSADGTVVDAIPLRKEDPDLEEFARAFLRASHFDPLPSGANTADQTGRIIITFAPGRKGQGGAR